MARKREDNKYNKYNNFDHLSIKFNSEQKEVLEIINTYSIIVLASKAGTGKTMLSVYAGLKGLSENKYSRLIITRPAVSTENLGHLPGDLNEKFTNIYLAPIIDFINKFEYINKQNFSDLINTKKILPIPIAYLRGFNMEDAFVIVDEAENMTEKQMLMVLTRLGKNSVMVINGDKTQSDLNIKEKPGFDKLIKLAQKPKCQEFMKYYELTKIERNEIIGVILDEWEKV